MKIDFLVGGIDSKYSDLIKSPMASIRMRCAIPANELLAKGLDVQVNADSSPRVDTDILVVGKLSSSRETKQLACARWLNYISKAKSNGAKIVMDCCENFLTTNDRNNPRSVFTEAALRTANLVTVNSGKMKEIYEKTATAPISVIEDPIEVPIQPARFDPHDPLRLMWFGHNSNLGYLEKWIADLSHSERPLILRVLTNIDSHWLKRLQRLQCAAVRISVAEWDINAMISAAHHADISILPSDKNDSRKYAVSSNRLTTSLALGLPTIATPLHSYLDWSDYFIATDDPIAGIKQFYADGKSLVQRLATAQTRIMDALSPRQIGNKWKDALISLS